MAKVPKIIVEHEYKGYRTIQEIFQEVIEDLVLKSIETKETESDNCEENRDMLSLFNRVPVHLF